MSNHCCNSDEVVFGDPCAAIANGDLTVSNYANFGLTKGQFLLLIAQCNTTGAIEDLTDVAEDILACCEAAVVLLTNIDENTDEIEGQLADIIVLLTDGNATQEDILVAVEAILVAVNNIDDNTDTIEALLATIITLLNAIDANTDGLEACCAAGNVILADILAAITSPTALGAHVHTSGTQAGAIPAGAYASWTIVRTNGLGNLNVDGLTVVNQGDATGDEALPQRTISAPVIVIGGGATYEWKAKT